MLTLNNLLARGLDINYIIYIAFKVIVGGALFACLTLACIILCMVPSKIAENMNSTDDGNSDDGMQMAALYDLTNRWF